MPKRSRKKKSKSKKSRKAQYVNSPGWVTYSRCFLITFSFLCIGLSVWGGVEHNNSPLPIWLVYTLIFMFLLGIFALSIALFGSKKIVESVADSSSTHEASILIMILAAPLFFILKAIKRK
jgi:hypothetical protein